MFFLLLFVTLGTSLATTGTVVRFFRQPIRQILERVVGPTLAPGWQRFLTFSLFVVGVSSGVQMWKLEQYLQPQMRAPNEPAKVLPLDVASLALEVYRAAIQAMQGMAWALLVFFVMALLAVAVIRWAELRSGTTA